MLMRGRGMSRAEIVSRHLGTPLVAPFSIVAVDWYGRRSAKIS